MDLLTHLVDAPLPNILIVAGLAFLGIAAVGKIVGTVEPDRTGRIVSGVLGAVLLIVGVFTHIQSDVSRTDSSKADGNLPSQNPLPPVTGNTEWWTPSQFQEEFNRRVGEGFYPDEIEGRCEDGSEKFRALWKGIPLGASFYTYNTMTKEDYDAKNTKLTSDGYSLKFLNSFKDCSGVDRYLATWLKGK